MRSKRFARLTAVVGGAAWALLHGTAALAQYPGGNTPPPTVGGEQFFHGGTAHTGTNILTALLVAAVLLMIGIALHRLSRRATPRDG